MTDYIRSLHLQLLSGKNIPLIHLSQRKQLLAIWYVIFFLYNLFYCKRNLIKWMNIRPMQKKNVSNLKNASSSLSISINFNLLFILLCTEHLKFYLYFSFSFFLCKLNQINLVLESNENESVKHIKPIRKSIVLKASEI